MGKLAGGRIVIAGGSNQLPGVRDLTSCILKGLVRTGAPRSHQAMPEEGRQAAFSVDGGLLEHALNPDRHIGVAPGAAGGGAQGGAYFARVGQWIRESF